EMIFDSTSKCGKIIDELFVNMEKEGSTYTFTTTGLLWQFIGEVLEQKSPCHTDDFDTVYRKNKQIKRVLTKIRNDYSKPLTLDDLAREAHLNSQYFCRAFKELTGKSPIDYLNYYRIECAAEQLRLPDLSVTEVALSCGFNDLSYFNRMFKRRKNMTPTQYRNKIM
ncbi:MAG: AraC family transcriptional regulator, partial [Clostridia bacterium]|nr:AraC family transcriptional regulator [Clostridia bacterium]